MILPWRRVRGGAQLAVPRGWVRLPSGGRRWVWGFALDAAPVTNRAWREFVAATGAARPPWMARPGFDDPEQPVVGITWSEAAAYARWAGKRLPTAAEWWRAVRGDDGRPYPWGATPPAPGHAVHGQRPERAGAPAAPSSGRPPGPYGHADLYGNVWEWCADGRCRGGFWGAARLEPDAVELETAPDTRSAGIGLRCAR